MILNISEHIYKTLTADDSLKEYVGEKVYPIATKTETSFPFIVFERDAVSPRYTKEKMATVSVNSIVYICAEDYTESINIAEAVIKALDRKTATYDTFKVDDAILTGAFEQYVNNTYVQQLNFTFIISE